MSEEQTVEAVAPTAQYVRARRATTVQRVDGTHAAAKEGSVWSTEQMSDPFIKQLATDGSWTANLFDTATQDEFDQHVASEFEPEEKDFMRGHLGEFGHVVLPEPDQETAFDEASSPEVDPERAAPITEPGTGTPSEETEEDGTTTEEEGKEEE